MVAPNLVNLSALIDNAKCFALVRQHRWPEGVRSPACGSGGVVRDGIDETQAHRQRYRCKACARRFDDLTGTVLAGHHRPLRSLQTVPQGRRVAPQMAWPLVVRPVPVCDPTNGPAVKPKSKLGARRVEKQAAGEQLEKASIRRGGTGYDHDYYAPDVICREWRSLPDWRR
jgi:hypothetical protein